MKLLLLIPILALSGCAVDSEGNARFDAAAFSQIVRTGAELYDRYNGAPAPTGYDDIR